MGNVNAARWRHVAMHTVVILRLTLNRRRRTVQQLALGGLGIVATLAGLVVIVACGRMHIVVGIVATDARELARDLKTIAQPKAVRLGGHDKAFVGIGKARQIDIHHLAQSHTGFKIIKTLAFVQNSHALQMTALAKVHLAVDGQFARIDNGVIGGRGGIYPFAHQFFLDV